MKKRALSLLLIFVTVVALVPQILIVAEATSGICGNNLTWVLDDTGQLTISGSGEMDNYYSTSGRYAPWYDYIEQILTVKIDEGVTSVGQLAFRNCSVLRDISLPSSIEKIGHKAFENCASLSRIDLPMDLKSIGSYAFYHCSNLVSIDIPYGVTAIQQGTFGYCVSLSKVTIPESVETIGSTAFYDCNSLTGITIPESVTDIFKSAFASCNNLTQITLPSSISKIDDYVFEACKRLCRITIPDTVTSIGECAFKACYQLETIDLPNGLISIGDKAFYSCFKINNVVIPKKVAVLGEETFAYCRELSQVYFKGSAPIFSGSNSFIDVNATAHYPIDNPTWTSEVMQHYGGTIIWIPTCENHSYKASIIDPTCTERGCTTHTCTTCGHSYEDAYVDALGHDLVATVVEPTCTEDGYYVISCTRCDYNEKHTTDATGHIYTAVLTAPTCTKQGFTTYMCTVCGDSYVSDYIDALGHDYADGFCTRCYEDDPNYETPVENPFTDVPAGAWFEKPVLWALENGITTGTSDTTFSPGDKCLRAHVVTFLWNAEKCPAPAAASSTFTDVPAGAWYEKPVLWAVENGITSGTSATKFGAGDVCSRYQVVFFLWKAAGSPEPKTTVNPFTDVNPGHFFYKAVLWAVENEITSGTSDTTFSPAQPCNRAQVVTFLYAAYN